MKKYTLEELRSDLYIEDSMYDEEFEEWKTDLIKVVDRINADRTLIPVLESDLQNEQDYLEECNKKMLIVDNINGVILYRKEVR